MKSISQRLSILLVPLLMLALFLPFAAVLAMQQNLVGSGAVLLVGSTLTATNPTLLDLAKALDPGGGVADIVELLNQTNEVLDDATFIEGNLATGHRTTIRTGIPTPTWRKMYGAVPDTKGTTVQVTDTCGMLEAYATIDKALADLNGNAKAFRLSEDKAHIEGMSQEIAQTLFYGNETTEPEAFTGLGPRYNSLSAANADNIIDHGGTGADNASIWLVVWGPRTVHGIIPKGSKAGMQVKDLGEQMIQESGGKWQAYVTHYRMDAGLTVRDWRYVVRICNIDVSDLATVANTKALVTSMIKATERVPVLGAGRAVFYANRIVRESLRLGILEKIGNNLSWETVAGKPVMVFDNIPVRRSDALLSTEARIT